MSEACRVFTGESPLVVSIPHDGREIPADISARMTPAGRALGDTDWHVAQLYGFANVLGATVVRARYSRYVVDLNRPPDDAALYPGQAVTGLCPAQSFAGEALYLDGKGVSDEERADRRLRYWQPYHDALQAALDAAKQRHGYALLWDAHSIASLVPGLFDGELPVLNLGTNRGASCANDIEDALWSICERADYPAVRNGRFVGGYITRHYGRPGEGVHAVQLELAQRSYMDEKTLRYDRGKASRLRGVLEELLANFMHTAAALHD